MRGHHPHLALESVRQHKSNWIPQRRRLKESRGATTKLRAAPGRLVSVSSTKRAGVISKAAAVARGDQSAAAAEELGRQTGAARCFSFGVCWVGGFPPAAGAARGLLSAQCAHLQITEVDF